MTFLLMAQAHRMPQIAPVASSRIVPETIKRALDGELYFYSKIFGFELADAIEPVPIENLPSG